MRRHHQTLLAALALCGVIATTSPALAQIDPGEISALEGRRDELTVELAEFDRELVTTAFERTDLAGVDLSERGTRRGDHAAQREGGQESLVVSTHESLRFCTA